MKRSTKVLSVLALGALVLLGMAGLPAVAQEDGVAVRINGVEITVDEYYEVLEREAGAFILSQLITEELISQKQAELDVEVSEADYQEVFVTIIQQLGGEQGLQQFLQQNGMSFQQLEEQLRWNLLISSLAQAEVEITEDEVVEWFEENQDFFAEGAQVEANHILVETEEEALALVEELEQGADFASLAMEHSIDPGSGPQGGFLGVFGRGVMVPQFENTAFALEVDELGVTASDFGWHIIKVTDRIEASEPTLDDVRGDVEKSLRQYKAMSTSEYMEYIEAESTIDVYLERFQ